MTSSKISSFVAARDALLSGDLDTLAALLDEAPGLATARHDSDRRPYDGYFNGATLLHHVAGNPTLGGLPDNILDGARLLLDRGADVDAVTLQGPSQPDDIGWTTLGLAATSADARVAGVQKALMDLLLEAGADPDARNGGCLMGALYYGESDAAAYLATRGARLDLVAAAGVGDLEALRGFLAPVAEGGTAAVAGGRRLAHYARVPWPTDAPPEVDGAHALGMALTYAALHGRVGALELLLEAGVDPNHRPPFEHRATPLHWAVMGDRPESVRVLLAAGADPDATDGEFGSTPAGWADYLGRPRAGDALQEWQDGRTP